MTSGIIRGAVSATLILLGGMCAIDASASYPKGYYDSLEGKCGAALKNAVKNVVKDHKEISYGDATWDVFRVTDVLTVNGKDYWWDMYSNNRILVSSGHGSMNIEHSVANSWWGKTKNAAYKDVVHLNPSDRDANSRKSNYPLAELGTVKWDNGVTFVGTPKSGQGGGSSWGYEPHDDYKGDFARVFMYMFTVYDDISWKSNTDWMYDTSSSLMFRSWARDLLLKWSSQDPVSEKERVRNDGIYSKQKNRNPYIDLPDLADHIWGSKSNVPYHLENGGSEDPDTPDPDDPSDNETKTYTWLSSTATALDDGWTIENVEMPEQASYIWTWDSHDGTQYLKGSCFINKQAYAAKAYAWSPEVDLTDAESVTFSFSHAARYQTTLRDLCKVAVRDAETGDIETLDISGWPTAGNWTFASSGDLDLGKYAGRKVHVGFLYESTDSGADTWEINDARLVVKKRTTGVENVPAIGEDEDDSFLVEVWGNSIAVPEGAVIYDLNGRVCSGENLSRGVYIVAKPTFRRAVKVLVK